MRFRLVKKYGNTFIIALTRSDMKDFELKEGDEIDIEDLIKRTKKKPKKK